LVIVQPQALIVAEQGVTAASAVVCARNSSVVPMSSGTASTKAKLNFEIKPVNPAWNLPIVIETSFLFSGYYATPHVARNIRPKQLAPDCPIGPRNLPRR
jgi:hypothetical protein